MSSPFPGMDPFIEACGLWGDFHDDLINEIKRALAQTVPPRYVVRTGERSYVVLIGSEGKDCHPFLPDVRVEKPRPRGRAEGPTRGTAVAAPASSLQPVPMRPFIEEEFRENFVEITDAENGNRLVTCVEALSPSNKVPGTKGWDLYQRKRQGLLLGEANLVEIDLLRGGQRMPMLDPWPSSPYTLLVSRPGIVPRCLVWPVSFQSPLPEFPVPLLKPDADVLLNLQPMVDAIYARSCYDRTIDYSRPLTPPLTAEESDSVQCLLRAMVPPAEPPPKPRRSSRRRS
jgi:hypothetical protein